MLSRELIRAMRGKRSQLALSRRLGFRTNVVYTWECGRSEPTALQLFHLAAATRRSPREALASFCRERPAWLPKRELDREAVAAFLEQERRGIPLVEIAEQTGVNRFSMARYLKCKADIKLPDLLRVLDYCTNRLPDFVALWADPAQVPSLAERWTELELARRAAYERPWSNAVLHCLELEDYQRSPKHQEGQIAAYLGISTQEERACLELLERSDQITWTGTHWRGNESRAVSLSADRAAARAQAAWWVRVAAERAATHRGMFAYNLCCVSGADLQRIAELQRECLRQIRGVIANSTPGERVALVNVQVMAFDAPEEMD